MALKNSHITIADRQIIEQGTTSGATKIQIAAIIGKDPTTVAKEIKARRILKYKCKLPLECAVYRKCKHGRNCTTSCPDFVQFKCVRRDRSPGVCNGCSEYSGCRFDKYRYYATEAEHDYRMKLVTSREGINATRKEIYDLGKKLLPLVQQGQTIYTILVNNPDIPYSEKTIYTYIEDGIFQDAGIPLTSLDLKRVVRRRMSKKKRSQYKPRKDKSYLKGRTEKDYEEYMEMNPSAHVVLMDTVYNDVTNGPFIQTFEFVRYDLFIAFYHTVKDSDSMLAGILELEEILGTELFEKEVEVIKTDRGTEFVKANESEMLADGTRRTHLYYCDPMASWQKGALENDHITLREICPKETDLYALGLRSQEALNRAVSHMNSYPREKLDGKTPFQLTEFLNPALVQRLIDYGLEIIEPNAVTLKPYLLKDFTR